MIRFLVLAMLWMLVSFALLWWVQVGIDRMHIDAAQSIGRAIESEPPKASGAIPDGGEAQQVLARAMAQKHTSPEDLAQVEFDRRELMRRLRLLWITLTLAPLLIGGWTAVRRNPPLQPATPRNTQYMP